MTKSNDIEAGNANATGDGREYALLALSFHDHWKDADIELSFRFSKPTKTQIKRLSDTAVRNSAQAARDILLGTIHPEEKAELLEKLEEYSGIATSYASVLIKGVGISADLGN
jgi:hypothetical protein